MPVPNVTKPNMTPVTPPQPGPSPFPNQQVAPLTPQQLQAMQLVSDQSGGTQDFLNQAMAQQAGVIGGDLLSPNNPYLAAYFNAASQPMIQNYEQAVAPNLLQIGAQTGSLGGSGMTEAFSNAQQALAEGLGNLGAGIYEPAYQQGLLATEQASQNAPNLAAGQYLPSQELMQSGQIGQSQVQNVLDTAYKNLYGQAQWPFQALSMLGGGLPLAAGPGGSSITTGPGMGGSMK